MNYSKPEITVLGQASSVIQGVPGKSLEIEDPVLPADCELDD